VILCLVHETSDNCEQFSFPKPKAAPSNDFLGFKNFPNCLRQTLISQNKKDFENKSNSQQNTLKTRWNHDSAFTSTLKMLIAYATVDKQATHMRVNISWSQRQ